MKMYDLKNKQVINENDCRILGCVIDIDFEPSNGCINSIIVPGPARLCGVFGREFVYVYSRFRYQDGSGNGVDSPYYANIYIYF